MLELDHWSQEAKAFLQGLGTHPLTLLAFPCYRHRQKQQYFLCTSKIARLTKQE
jgi:hypothetical protein